MKIHSSDPLSRLKDVLSRIENSERSDRSDKVREDDNAQTGSTRDAIQLSQQAREIGQLKQALASAPEIREELVEKLREEIASGNYRIDGTRIADALLREEADLSEPRDDVGSSD